MLQSCKDTIYMLEERHSQELCSVDVAGLYYLGSH